jgi:hypothetical protein
MGFIAFVRHMLFKMGVHHHFPVIKQNLDKNMLLTEALKYGRYPVVLRPCGEGRR